MQLTLIRHSKTTVNPEAPIPRWGLSPEGIELAEKLSHHPAIKELDVIYSSLQTKALETALYLAKPNYIPLRTHPGLTEITSVTNRFLPDFEEKIKRLYCGELSRISKGETLLEARERFQETLQSITSWEEKVDNVGIVSHGNILAVFTARLSDQTPYQLHKQIQMPDFAVIEWETSKLLQPFGQVKESSS